MPTAILNEDIRLTFDVFGGASGPPVVLISGAGAPAEFWPDTFCRSLASYGFEVIRYCHRDTGSSSHFGSPYGIDVLLADLKAFIDVLGHARVHVVGHSMGGYLVQLAMCEFPHQLYTGTSISAGSAVSEGMHAELGTSAPDPKVWEVLMANQPTGDFDLDLPGWIDSWRFLNGTRQFDEVLATDYTRALYEGDDRNAQVATNHVHAMGTVPVWLVTRLPHTEVSLLVLHGTEDPLVPFDNGEATARLAGSSTFHPLIGAGHMFFNHHAWGEIRTVLIRHLSSDAWAEGRRIGKRDSCTRFDGPRGG
jgi:pimeloyl-ACP methyl ester carboxylesterase